MSKTDIAIQNVIGNMALEGITLDNEDIYRVKQLNNPKLTSAQITALANKMKQDILKELKLI